MLLLFLVLFICAISNNRLLRAVVWCLHDMYVGWWRRSQNEHRSAILPKKLLNLNGKGRGILLAEMMADHIPKNEAPQGGPTTWSRLLKAVECVQHRTGCYVESWGKLIPRSVRLLVEIMMMRYIFHLLYFNEIAKFFFTQHNLRNWVESDSCNYYNDFFWIPTLY